MNGALVIDKPEGITSHDVVATVRRVLGERRIGHLGTLDPFATGVLVLLVGCVTRLARFFNEREKSYEGTIRFGFSTDTYDRTGNATSNELSPNLNEPELTSLFSLFEGEYQQQPPSFSAKKVAGVPAYRLARKGREVELAREPVFVRRFELVKIDGARADFLSEVSSGTYIRSLVHDMGQRQGSGAHLVSLRRTRVGEFSLEQAITLDDFARDPDRPQAAFVPSEDLLPELPAIAIDGLTEGHVRHGIDISLEATSEWVRLIGPSGTLTGMGRRIAPGLYHPAIVLRPVSAETVTAALS